MEKSLKRNPLQNQSEQKVFIANGRTRLFTDQALRVPKAIIDEHAGSPPKR